MFSILFSKLFQYAFKAWFCMYLFTHGNVNYMAILAVDLRIVCLNLVELVKFM